MEFTATKDLGFKETFKKWNGKYLTEDSYDTVISSIGVEDDTIKIYRDFFGQKPLYYYENKEIFVSSSTIKSISYIYEKIYGNKLTLNKFSIDTYLLFGFNFL